MSAQPVVQVEDLDVYYGTSQILFGVGLSVRQGETMALLGRNGAGKSTTMKAIMGLAPARRGKVTLRGRVLSGMKPHRIARAGLGFVPEDRQIFPEHTVEDNLVIGHKKGPNGEDEWPIRRIYDVFPLLVPQRLQQGEDVVDPPDRPFVLAIGALLVADDEIVLDRMLRKDLAVFGDKAEPRARDAMRLHAGQHAATQRHLAAPRRRQAHDRLHGGRFACTVAAEQRHGLTLPYRKAHAEQDLAGAIIDVEVFDLNNGLRAHIA